MSKERKGLFLFTLFLGLFGRPTFAQDTGIFTDDRDGQIYKTVTYQMSTADSVFEISWLAENLSFKTPNSHCFQAGEDMCEERGRLYNWFDAMQSCPVSWRLPNDQEWTQLVNLYGGIKNAGRHLKANKKNWRKGKGTNKSLFNGLPTGASDPNGFYHEQAGFFWSATLSNENPKEASDWSFVPWLDEMRHWYGGKEMGNAVRCVKN